VQSLVRGPVEIVAGRVLDMDNHTILPGLIDLHVHVRASSGPPAMADPHHDTKDHFKALLRSGITTVLDLGTERHIVFALRQRIQDGLLAGPCLLAAGAAFTPTGGHPCVYGRPGFDLCTFVDGAADVDQSLIELAGEHPDAFKIIIESGTQTHPLPTMSHEVIEALVDRGEKLQVPVIAHISRTADIVDALDAGVRFFAHLPVRDRLDDAVAERLARVGAVVIPTVVVEDARYRASLGPLEEVGADDAKSNISEDVLAAWRDPAMVASWREPKMQQEAQRRRDNVLDNLRICHRAGVRIVAGTDAGNPAVFHGISMHREFALYVQAGLSAVEALRAATSEAARVMGLADRGRIEAGMRADLLVVRGNPLADIQALRDVRFVYRLGQRLTMEELSVDGAYGLERGERLELAEGAACLADEECAEGLGCTWLGWCRRPCGDGSCPTEQACFDWDRISTWGYCEPGDGCDPIGQDCPNGVACVWLGAGVSRCWFASQAVAGQACSSWETCARGFQCDRSTNTCVRLCDPSGASDCEQGQECEDRGAQAQMLVGECR